MSPAERKPTASRAAFIPCLFAAFVLIASLGLVGVGGGWYTIIRYVTCILALIVCVFAVQGKKWWWLVGLIPIVVLWNPVFPIKVDEFPLQLLQLAAAAFLIACGFLLRLPLPQDRR